MLPFMNRAVGISSLLGVLYYTTFHGNKTGTPGLEKWFGGVPVSPADNPVVQEGVLGETEQQTKEEGGLFDGLLLDVPLTEEKAFVAPLELIVLDQTSIDGLYKGNCIVIGHLDYVQSSRRFLKRFLAFFEHLSELYNYDDLGLSFAILNLSDHPEDALRLNIDSVPSVHIVSEGRLLKRLGAVEDRVDWRIMEKLVKSKAAWTDNSDQNANSKDSSRQKAVLWYRSLQFNLGLRLIKFYSHDQMVFLEWLKDSRLKQAVFALGISSLSLFNFLKL